MASKKQTIDAFVDNIVTEAATAVTEQPIKTVDEAAISVAASKGFNNAELKRKGLVSKYRSENKVAVSISPFYAPYLGRIVRQIVNGIVVDVPCDGQTYYINETHASHIISKIKRIDAMISRQNKAGDVKNNFEYSPGQLHI